MWCVFCTHRTSSFGYVWVLRSCRWLAWLTIVGLSPCWQILNASSIGEFGRLLKMHLRSTSDPLNQSLHFKKNPRWFFFFFVHYNLRSYCFYCSHLFWCLQKWTIHTYFLSYMAGLWQIGGTVKLYCRQILQCGPCGAPPRMA